jgi:hypothetical protein
MALEPIQNAHESGRIKVSECGQLSLVQPLIPGHEQQGSAGPKSQWDLLTIFLKMLHAVAGDVQQSKQQTVEILALA